MKKFEMPMAKVVKLSVITTAGSGGRTPCEYQCSDVCDSECTTVCTNNCKTVCTNNYD